MNNNQERLYNLADSIVDPNIRSITNLLLLQAPQSFWTKPSAINHHNEEDRGPEGNLKHSIKVAAMFLELAEAVKLSQYDKDVGLSGSILHDVKKYGPDGTAPYTLRNHDAIACQWVLQEFPMDVDANAIATAIACHAGIWGTVPHTPKISREDLLHIADYVVSRSGIEYKIP